MHSVPLLRRIQHTLLHPADVLDEHRGDILPEGVEQKAPVGILLQIYSERSKYDENSPGTHALQKGDELVVVVDELRVNIGRLEKCRVIERNEMQAIFMEQDFKQSDGCDLDCGARIGKLLGGTADRCFLKSSRAENSMRTRVTPSLIMTNAVQDTCQRRNSDISCLG